MIHIAICDDEEVFVEKIRDEVRAVLETQDEDFEIFCYTDGNKLLADYEAKNLHGFGINSMKKICNECNGMLEFYEILDSFVIHIMFPKK